MVGVSLFFTAVRAYVFNSAGASPRLRVLASAPSRASGTTAAVWSRPIGAAAASPRKDCEMANESCSSGALPTSTGAKVVAADYAMIQHECSRGVPPSSTPGDGRPAEPPRVRHAEKPGRRPRRPCPSRSGRRLRARVLRAPVPDAWRLACLATAVVPFLIGATFLAMRVVKRLAKESQAALARAGAVAQEGDREPAGRAVLRRGGASRSAATPTPSGTPTRPSGRRRTPSLALGLRQAGVQVAACSSRRRRRSGLALGAGRLVLRSRLLVVRGQMTTGDLVAIWRRFPHRFVMLLTIAASLSVLAQTGASVVEAVGASVEIFAVIDREPAIPNEWSSKSDDDRATELRLREATRRAAPSRTFVFPTRRGPTSACSTA